MAESSITHNFVIKDKKSIELLADALSKPKTELPKSVKSVKYVSGAEEIALLMSKWKNKNNDARRQAEKAIKQMTINATEMICDVDSPKTKPRISSPLKNSRQKRIKAYSIRSK